jgi:hypothetical protein
VVQAQLAELDTRIANKIFKPLLSLSLLPCRSSHDSSRYFVLNPDGATGGPPVGGG